MERKLVTIQKIKDIKPIPDADNIETAYVNNWAVVVKKQDFKVGDYCVFFEIDSLLPIREEYEFLRKSSYTQKEWMITDQNPNGEGFRLKTTRLRGQISQGLVLPLTIVEGETNYEQGSRPLVKTPKGFQDLEIGADLTEAYGVIKYDPPIPAGLGGQVKGNFPHFMPKTDQERIQNLDLEDLVNDSYEVSVKLDGTSLTAYCFQGVKGVCSRNLEMKMSNKGNTMVEIAEAMNIPEGFAIQGELIGPGIQKNKEKLNKPELRVFDIFDITNQVYLSSDARLKMCEELGLNHVPILDKNFSIEGMSIEDLLAMADGPSLNPDTKREGIVFKSIIDPQKSFKVISNGWLLKNQ